MEKTLEVEETLKFAECGIGVIIQSQVAVEELPDWEYVV